MLESFNQHLKFSRKKKFRPKFLKIFFKDPIDILRHRIKFSKCFEMEKKVFLKVKGVV